MFVCLARGWERLSSANLIREIFKKIGTIRAIFSLF